MLERLPVQAHAVGMELLLHEDRVDGLEDWTAVRLERERASQENQRLFGLIERGKELSGTARELRARRVVRSERLELRRVDLGEALLGASDAREPLELLDRVLVGEVLVQKLRGGLERGAVVFFLLL